MKKLVALMIVLAISGVAGASLSLGTGGMEINEITLAPSDVLVIQVIAASEVWATGLGIFATGPSTVDVTNAVVIGNPASETTGALGVVNFTGGEGYEAYSWVLYADLSKPVIPAPAITNGVVVDNIVFHCEGPGDVTIVFMQMLGDEPTQLGTFVIHQVDVPEPMTLGLLGLGGLFLRRRLA